MFEFGIILFQQGTRANSKVTLVLCSVHHLELSSICPCSSAVNSLLRFLCRLSKWNLIPVTCPSVTEEFLHCALDISIRNMTGERVTKEWPLPLISWLHPRIWCTWHQRIGGDSCSFRCTFRSLRTQCVMGARVHCSFPFVAPQLQRDVFSFYLYLNLAFCFQSLIGN